MPCDSSRNDPRLGPNDAPHHEVKHGNQFATKLEWLGVRLLAYIIPRLSRRLAVQFAQIAGTIAAYLDLAGRRVALSNLEAAFGDRFSATERARITRQSYQQFAGTMIDLFWSPRVNAKNYRKLIDFGGFEEFARTVGPTSPCIYCRLPLRQLRMV